MICSKIQIDSLSKTDVASMLVESAVRAITTLPPDVGVAVLCAEALEPRVSAAMSAVAARTSNAEKRKPGFIGEPFLAAAKPRSMA